jgi:starch-binding outer membrane protein, SusD/RagB family
MKKRFLTIALLAGLMMGSTACEDLLEVQPQNALSPEVALDGIVGYNALLTSAYDRLQSFNYWGRDFALMGDALADNITTNSNQAGGRYVAENTNAPGAHYGIWNTAYGAINDVNIIIASIDNLTVTAAQEDEKKLIKAQALALRAMIYFDLARVYGYEPNKIQNGFNKSVVLRLQPTNVSADATTQNRATVEEVYKQIETDFKAAISTYPAAGQAITNRQRLNKPAAHALLGKVYLYWEKFDLAIEQFNTALSTTTAVLDANYVASFAAATHPGSLFEINFDAAVEMAGVTGVNNSLFSYTQPRVLNPNKLGTFGGQTVAAELRNLFETGDKRADLFYVSATSTSGATTFLWAYKYRSSRGDYTDNPIVIRYADVMLMKAEALVRKATPDVAEAIQILTTLRTARGASITAIPLTASALDTFIQEERRRELYFEGHRFFDLKRRGQLITKPAAALASPVPITDYRILAPLPNGEVIFNPELPQNPGY